MASNSQLLALVDRLRHMPPEKVEAVLKRLPADEKVVILELLEELGLRKKRQMATEKFMEFVHAVWPSFIEGKHHIRIAHLFEQVARGELKRLVINLPPRHTKSEFASYLFPAWFLGKFPHKKIIQASHTAELAVGFGRKVRNLVDSEVYQTIFPQVKLQSDSKAAGRWNTNFSGDYFAVGVGGAVAGKGADLCIKSGSYIITDRGKITIDQVKIGDRVLTERGFRLVTQKIKTTHRDTYTINAKLKVSHNHPIFVFNKGFVDASEVRVGDILYTTNICDIISSSITIGANYAKSIFDKRLKVFSLFTGIQHMGINASTMQQPQCSKLQQLWRAWYKDLRALEAFKKFHRRYGASPINQTHSGSHRQRWGLYSGELSMGITRGATKQAPEQCIHYSVWKNTNYCTVGTGDWTYQRYNYTSSVQYGDDSRRSTKGTKNELGSEESYQASLGRLRNKYVQLLSRRQKSSWWVSEYLELLIRKSQNCIGVLVGVRRVDSIEKHNNVWGDFYNLTVEDTHTFIVDSYLTHNCIIDDPISEQEAMAGMYNSEVHDRIYEWYTSGPRQRLQPNGSLIIVQTRWSQKDLTGQVLKAAAMRGSDEWKVVEFPAILPSGEPLWPEFWSKAEIEAVRDELPTYQWNAQYMQQPTGERNAIIKRDWWQWWEETEPPRCEFIIQSWDTAHETKTVNDYSACTTWGVWYNAKDRDLPNIILLNAFRDRLEFPDLKRVAFQEWKEWEPDSFLIEKKAAGAPLIQEFRAMGIPVQEFSPGKGQDKISRLNAVADIFASGKVWVPRTRWAEEVVDEVAAFPSGEHDDYVDNVSLVLARFRQGGYVTLPSDEPEPIQYFKSNRSTAYY